jgi:uncharacterized Fe-S cluster-containing radical SAM superfamily enzyme
MSSDLIYVDEKSEIPLFGVDFIGVIDRGTNVIEIKCNTKCNLKCKYCFVSSGDYDTNFIVNSEYLLSKVKKVVEIKGNYDIEIHIAPYGEILLYPELIDLITKLWEIEGITIISMQSNGLLLTKDIIKKLEEAHLTRINLSINTLNEQLAKDLCDCEKYDIKKLLENINLLLASNIDILLAPVWFPGQNDLDIEEIIKYFLELRKYGHLEGKIRLGIQKYLIYKTGRKLKKIRPKTWNYFYKQLSKLEKKYQVKLKLGPNDFGIHKRSVKHPLNLHKGDILSLKIVSKGRWGNECIGKINDEVGVKVLLKKPYFSSDDLIGKVINAKIIKANYKDNILTSVFPF